MHGFFIDIRLYNKIRAIALPNAYEEWKKEQIHQKMEQKRESRITPIKRGHKFPPSKLPTPPSAESQVDERFSKLLSDTNFNREVRSLQDLEDYSEISEDEPEKTGKEENSRDDSIEESPQQEDEAEKLVDINQSLTSKRSISKKLKPQKPNPSKRKVRFFEAKDDSVNPIKKSPQELLQRKERLVNANFRQRLEIENKLQSGNTVISGSSSGPMTFTFKPESRNTKSRQKNVTTKPKQRRRRFTK